MLILAERRRRPFLGGAAVEEALEEALGSGLQMEVDCRRDELELDFFELELDNR
jgi:hypothetical protein